MLYLARLGLPASHIGLVNTMVFTHVPSSLLLVTVSYAPTFGMAAVLFPQAAGAGGAVGMSRWAARARHRAGVS